MSKLYVVYFCKEKQTLKNISIHTLKEDETVEKFQQKAIEWNKNESNKTTAEVITDKKTQEIMEYSIRQHNEKSELEELLYHVKELETSCEEMRRSIERAIENLEEDEE